MQQRKNIKVESLTKEQRNIGKQCLVEVLLLIKCSQLYTLARIHFNKTEQLNPYMVLELMLRHFQQKNEAVV